MLDNTIDNFDYCQLEMKEVLYQSFLSDEMKVAYEKLLNERMMTLVRK
jgi:hypothetical protein